MIDKILKFLEIYVNNLEQTIKKVGKYKTISAGLNLLIQRQSFTYDELRKDLSFYIKRVISENEFNQLLDYDTIEYALLFYK